MTLAATILISVAILTWLACFYKRDKNHDRKYTTHTRKMPQPMGSPLVGNLFQIRQANPWIQMSKWTKELGPIYRLKMGRSDLIVLGTPKAAVELLEKRSSKYSSRPRNIMTSEYVSKGLRLTFMPYDDLWRRQRKLLHLLTQPKAASNYHPIQSQESAQLCLDIFNHPQEHWKHSQRYAGSTVLQIAFNRRALSIEDPAITSMRECNEKMIETAVPGRYLIDSLPILSYLPSILSPWKQYGNQLFNETLDLFGELYRGVTQQSHPLQQPFDPAHGACFVARIESLKDSYRLTDNQAIFLAGAMFGAGSDTTADAIETFIFACAANPDKVAKAQEELDRVVGRDRLPEFSDEEALVYCGAMVRELLRWRTVIPGGLAHMSTEDDEYEGYFIPKGTTIVANHWSIHLDEETYKDPQRFIPERFIDTQTGLLIGTKWSTYGHHAFGFGRRICPALHIANKSLFITFTRLLWSFEIKIKSSSAMSTEEFVRSIKFSTGFSSHPINLNDSFIEILPRDSSTFKVLTEAVEHAGVDPIKL
ncbi:hypothetical protein PTTG_06719 [Puccinia triticina 1-1 BBBD Race 1]|uniref:Cytochrome P450 n=2 Tax=Puccinia triticina TaxID=208348 RepID=A0A180GNG3_PUCT1|nr:uncharacterized protein PtA15_2A35 [Puccinia triticina]OAV94008.1 hypothetical protein PTTG_06719 [Puccinia triticina 1-1 BBBD Race 1]WAQ81724.1 hypothetical protein PtA15_2A35 [Puccinia triticina]WAR52611.1 hypothetical protein PtB15_2B35 [Puccinia triticina]